MRTVRDGEQKELDEGEDGESLTHSIVQEMVDFLVLLFFYFIYFFVFIIKQDGSV